jgi:hypothetical protein
MTVLLYLLSVPLIAESGYAPVNLWNGRTTANWVRFTGLSSRSAQVFAAPAKLATAALLILGLVWRPAGLAGAGSCLAIALFYLARLGHPARRGAVDGIAAFALFGSLGAALFAVQLLR